MLKHCKQVINESKSSIGVLRLFNALPFSIKNVRVSFPKDSLEML